MTKIVVIGGGPGGYVAAIRAAQLGADVTLIEKEKLGGVCLNVGCIPTKALLQSAELFISAKAGANAGVLCEPKLDFNAVQQNRRSITETLVRGVTGLMRANKIEVLNGVASFESADTVLVKGSQGERTITADKFIIASGSVPAMPPVPGLDSPCCIDSTGALEMQAIPKSMVIIGGGVIGVELATAYNAFGTEITIVEMLPEILPTMDSEIAGFLRKRLSRQGITIVTGAKVTAVKDEGPAARVIVEVNGEIKELTGEKVLVCVGRRANTGMLNLAGAGVNADAQGRIAVDSGMRTNIMNIYAIGDCLGKTTLAHVASQQGEVAAENALGHTAVYDESTNPSCVYTHPEVACVGLTEEQCREKNIPCVIGKFPLAANGKSLIMNGGEGFIKLIAGERYGQILGVHIAGPHATDLIAEGALAIRLEATADELISTIHAHPTVGEAVREAALHTQKRAIHVINS